MPKSRKVRSQEKSMCFWGVGRLMTSLSFWEYFTFSPLMAGRLKRWFLVSGNVSPSALWEYLNWKQFKRNHTISVPQKTKISKTPQLNFLYVSQENISFSFMLFWISVSCFSEPLWPQRSTLCCGVYVCAEICLDVNLRGKQALGPGCGGAWEQTLVAFTSAVSQIFM